MIVQIRDHNITYLRPASSLGSRKMDKSTTQSPASSSSDHGSGSERAPRRICPHCHKSFKDLKAHAFVHAKERPEKCPIKSCEYHTRGFSRKHDRNRHALNHYRGSLICGFCPGVGTPAEVMYNRLDLFKKHLVERHEVPMKPPNGHRPPCTRSGLEAPGGCSCNVCRQMFLSPDDLYDHIDDCVLRVLNEEIRARPSTRCSWPRSRRRMFRPTHRSSGYHQIQAERTRPSLLAHLCLHHRRKDEVAETAANTQLRGGSKIASCR